MIGKIALHETDDLNVRWLGMKLRILVSHAAPLESHQIASLPATLGRSDVWLSLDKPAT